MQYNLYRDVLRDFDGKPINQKKRQDEAVRNVIRDIILPFYKTTNGKSIPVVFATVDRAFDQARKHLGIKDGGRVPRPLASINPSLAERDFIRRNNSPMVIKDLSQESTVDESGNYVPKTAWTAYFPIPVNINYEVDFFFSRVSDIQIVQEHIYQCFFNQIYYIVVDFGPVYKKYLLPLTLESLSDNSNLEGGTENRDIRMSATFLLEGFFFRPPKRARLVNTINIGINGVENLQSIYDDKYDELYALYISEGENEGKAAELADKEAYSYAMDETLLDTITIDGEDYYGL